MHCYIKITFIKQCNYQDLLDQSEVVQQQAWIAVHLNLAIKNQDYFNYFHMVIKYKPCPTFGLEMTAGMKLFLFLFFFPFFFLGKDIKASCLQVSSFKQEVCIPLGVHDTTSGSTENFNFKNLVNQTIFLKQFLYMFKIHL